MNLTMQVILELAEHLENAELQARDVVKITDAHPNMDWEDAYAIQDQIRLRKEARGIRTVGFKAGLTSHAKMKQMGVDAKEKPWLFTTASTLTSLPRKAMAGAFTA